MKFYFEFNKHEYYGLVVAEANTYGEALQKSYQIYQSQIAGDSIQEVMDEGKPDLIDEATALEKFVHGCRHENMSEDEINKEFHSSTDIGLLIDYSLL